MWRQTMGSALRLTVLVWLLCGLGYPLLEVGISDLAFPAAANGSLVRVDHRIVGSRLIGERFTGPMWFKGRPSATGDNPMHSGASNLGPLSRRLRDHLWARRAQLVRRHPSLAARRLPADMITTSGSGLDPDISLANADLQAPWVARARGLPLARVQALIAHAAHGRWLGLFGEPRVNVQVLNWTLAAALGRR
ncbi:MAG: potassium-transporting ATPase subunit KdpC [Gammaproteobacteria bacterium]|nr:potassium-transporting ATPase subunit KdpC [Gammaproteobacteria bacterium]